MIINVFGLLFKMNLKELNLTDTILTTIRWYRKGTNLTLTQKCRREQFKKNVEICIKY